MTPKMVTLPDKTIAFKIPVNSVEQTKQAMKVHVRMLDALGGTSSSTSYVVGTATEGQLGAMYRTTLLGVGGERTFFQTYTIAECSENKVVYNATGTGSNMSGNSVLTIEVGNEKNEMGKDMLVIHSSQDVPGCNTVLLCCVLLPFGMCCLAPFLKAGCKACMESTLKQTMIDVQNFVNTYNVPTEPGVTNPIQTDHIGAASNTVIKSGGSDNNTEGLVKKF